MSEIRVLLVGVHGHGRWHLRNVGRLSHRGGVRLVGVCDVRPPTDDLSALAGSPRFSTSLDELLALTQPHVTIICTPIQTHVDLALAAMRSGSHVLLEKPPAPTLAEYVRLLDGGERAGVDCQVGFQSLGSEAPAATRRLIADGAVGEVLGIGGAGAWAREAGYYARAPWAGRRRLDGLPVVDGVLTNPFAHAVETALGVDGSQGGGDLLRIETELYRANPIEADDTSCVRLSTVRGTTITVAATVCASRNHDPYVRVHGSRGRITLWYKRHQVRVESPAGVATTTHPETDLLDNLVAHIRDPEVPLLAPLRRAHAFTRVVEAIRTGPDPAPIPQRYRTTEPTGCGQIVAGVERVMAASADSLSLFSELGVPWATGSAATTLRTHPPGPAGGYAEAIDEEARWPNPSG